MRKILPIVLTCITVLGCSAGQESADADPGSYSGKTPGTPNAVIAALYQPILEPFTATFTYTHTTYDQQTTVEETYAAVKTTIVQDADLDISVLESGRRWNGNADHMLVDGELYVRNRELSDDAKTDLAGVDKNHWVPYHDWVTLTLEATESYVLSGYTDGDIEKPDTSWWNTNQDLVRDRLERLAGTIFGDETTP